MLSTRIRYAMAHLSRKQHISLLARPNWRRIQRLDMNTLPEPFSVSRAALKSRASKRIRIMAQPKYTNRKYDPTKSPSYYTKIHPKTLAGRTSKRVSDLALPKKRLLLAAMKITVNADHLHNMSESLSRIQDSRYQRYRLFCMARQRREMRRKQRLKQKMQKALATPEDWERHMEVLERIAAPKIPPKPKYPDRRRKWRPVNMRRVEELAQPVARDEPEIRDPFTVPAAALTYNITDRLQQIAFPKSPPEIIPPRIPGTVSRAALKATASSRTKILAKPMVRPAGMETDLREDAFTVSPAALKARCTKRLKVLARPKSYGK